MSWPADSERSLIKTSTGRSLSTIWRPMFVRIRYRRGGPKCCTHSSFKTDRHPTFSSASTLANMPGPGNSWNAQILPSMMTSTAFSRRCVFGDYKSIAVSIRREQTSS